MRIFDNYPKDFKCPVCGTDKQGSCALIAIDNTQEGNIEEAIPVHIDCIDLRYMKEHNLIYQRML